MLTVNYSPDWRTNSRLAVEAVCRVPSGSRSIVIVPEQNSFDAEWALCEAGGDRISQLSTGIASLEQSNSILRDEISRTRYYPSGTRNAEDGEPEKIVIISPEPEPVQ